jgi:hypothetical protein
VVAARFRGARTIRNGCRRVNKQASRSLDRHASLAMTADIRLNPNQRAL